tara:strand:- start:18122 stop:18634 length:513 start_codon:yes stop_codon:yes gene_type:complete
MQHKSSQAQVAAIIRKELKAMGVPARVTSSGYSGGNSVDVCLMDIPYPKVEKIRGCFVRYQEGHFNGGEDIYEYSNTRDDIPQTKFLFINSAYSPALRQSAWDFIKKHWQCEDTEKAPAQAAELFSYHGLILGRPGDQILQTILNGSFFCAGETTFWDYYSAQGKAPLAA